MHLRFRNAEKTDLPVLMELVQALYAEDPSPRQPTPDHTRLTMAEFEKYPQKGRIQMFEVAGAAVGYALLVHFWSNEYGGNKIIIDEIYVRPEFRGQGIASSYFRYLEREYPLPAVALELEVTPDNHAARRLYENAGFRLAKNNYFNKLIRHAND